MDDGSTLDRAQALCSEWVTWIDLKNVLQGDDVFYRTDHHWSTMGAYQGYQALMTSMTGSYTQLDTQPTLVVRPLLRHHLVLRGSGLDLPGRDVHLGA